MNVDEHPAIFVTGEDLCRALDEVYTGLALVPQLDTWLDE